MKLSQGFQIEQPNVFVPWDITENALIGLLNTPNLRVVTSGHFSLSCISLRGLSHELSFHFKPRVSGNLKQLEFYLKNARSLTQSFKKLQSHFENVFGAPTVAKHVRQNFPEYSYTWNLKGVRIEHHVKERTWDADSVTIIRL